MNTKLLIALPILALLSIGAVFLIAHKKAHVVDNIPVVDGTTVDETPKDNNTTVDPITPKNTVDIDDWQRCFQKLPVKMCDDLTTEADRSDCYSASYQASQLVFPDTTKELPSCVSFYQYQKASQTDAPVNYNKYYQDCFLNADAVKAAKTSAYYYNSIYAPKYITCAGF
ncbi:P28 protein (macronuclear) [Tetrahymena thermophila SB210]|uniref:P28 protein n=1 Tax=Tetrahymena thermophila (strain SB210) TaxID=312017 RepID=Q22NY4_TETTS|nr:P28 protein [Tetrahymena thermophila SB210]EAR87027.3 P28 protein [Tetrahymena thermophila SB210]|eukprot:XP_001007272.3 P28 protein [Tetrahymena thermophila SB210]